MDCSDSSLEDRCRFGRCQIAVAQASEQPKVDEGVTAAHTDGEAGGECVQASGCGENTSGETDAMAKSGCCGKTPTKNTTKDGFGSDCCSSSLMVTAREEKSMSVRHIDANVDAGCYDSTSTLDKDKTTGKANITTFTRAADKCGTSCCSRFVDLKADVVEGTPTIFGQTAVKAEEFQMTAYQDKYCSSENTPVPDAACESDCGEDVLEKQAAKQIIAVSSNDGDSDCCAGKKAPCCNGKWR
jgi:hypothetical protein